jgi:PmbA protein
MPYSLEVAPGRRKGEELLAGIENGIYLRSLIGYGQSNLINGDFSSNVALGFRIKNGKIVGRVKNTMIAGNIYELFRKGVELSSDRDPVVRMPSAVIEGLSVSAAKQ